MSKALHQILEIEDREVFAQTPKASARPRETFPRWSADSELDTRTQSMRPGGVRAKQKRSDSALRSMDWKAKSLPEARAAREGNLHIAYDEDTNFGGPFGVDSSSQSITPEERPGTQSPRYTLRPCTLPREQGKSDPSHLAWLPLSFSVDTYNSTCRAPLPSAYHTAYCRSLTKLRAPISTPLAQTLMQRRSRTVSSLRSVSRQLNSRQIPYQAFALGCPGAQVEN